VIRRNNAKPFDYNIRYVLRDIELHHNNIVLLLYHHNTITINYAYSIRVFGAKTVDIMMDYLKIRRFLPTLFFQIMVLLASIILQMHKPECCFQ